MWSLYLFLLVFVLCLLLFLLRKNKRSTSMVTRRVTILREAQAWIEPFKIFLPLYQPLSLAGRAFLAAIILCTAFFRIQGKKAKAQSNIWFDTFCYPMRRLYPFGAYKKHLLLSYAEPSSAYSLRSLPMRRRETLSAYKGRDNNSRSLRLLPLYAEKGCA